MKLDPGELRKLLLASLHPDGIVDMDGLRGARAYRRRRKNNDLLSRIGLLKKLPDGDYQITAAGRAEVAKYQRNGIPAKEEQNGRHDSH